MERTKTCPECGAIWQNTLTCQDYFHQLLAWEAEYPDKTYAVHHLTIVDVTAAGVDAYLDTVKAWARSMNEALKASGNDV